MNLRGFVGKVLFFVFAFGALGALGLPADAKSICAELMARIELSGPAVLPDAPPTKPIPVRPQPRPDTPQRRQVPIPAPDPSEPSRQVPEKPLEDPKDIQPDILYSTDSKVASFWNEMPIGLRRLMIEEMRKERDKLQSHMQTQYGGADGRVLAGAVIRLQNEIERIEASHKGEILAVIRELMESRYGETVEGLSIQITESRPTPQNLSIENGQMLPELPRSLDKGMIYRTELRNLWLQGEGWIGMKEFAYEYAPQLNAIYPGLAEKYQELDRLYRYGQLVQLDMIPSPTVIDQIPKDMISAGREIVTTNFEVVVSPDGSQSVQVREIHGVAVGRNAWAAVHEARKAASQMVTPAEGAFRWLMPPERRAVLDEATNSARAEIRQGVFGPAVVVALRKRIELLSNQRMSEEQYYQVVEGLFSLHPGAFVHVSHILFDSDFENSSTLQNEAFEFLRDQGVL